MDAKKRVKRFISGAVCPRCAQMDKLIMFINEHDHQVRECVRCGYQDMMTDNGPQQIIKDEIATRVNQPRVGEEPLAHEEEVQIVNILDPRQQDAKRRDH